MVTLLLVRHGESTANREHIFAGQYDVELQDRGLVQAKRTAEYIAANYTVEKVYASDLKRAYATGKCIADVTGAEIVPDKNLREISAGCWDGMKFDEIGLAYADDYDVWKNDIGNAVATNGESVSELACRVMKKLTDIAVANNGKTVVVATHATPIRAVQSLVETGGLEQMKSIPWVSNASVSALNYDDGRWSFEYVSFDKHLEDLKTSLPGNV